MKTSRRSRETGSPVASSGLRKPVHDHPPGFLEGISLEDARAHWAAVVESSEDAIISKTLSGMILSWNHGAQRIYGYSAREAVGQPIGMLAPPERQHEISEALEAIRQGGRVESLETIRVRKDGRRVAISLSVSPVFGSDGRIVAAAAIARDITAKKEAERAIAESEARLKGIIGSAMDAIITIDADQRITLFNEAAERMFGTPKEAALGMPLERFIPERYRARHRQHITTFDHTGVSMRSMGPQLALAALRADGTEFPMEATISQVLVEDRKLFTVILRDITERKQAEEMLRESEKRFRLMADAAPQLIWSATPTGTPNYFNRYWGEYFGVNVAALPREKYLALIHPDDHRWVMEGYATALAHGKEFAFEVRCRRHDGTYRWHLARGTPVRDASGQIIRWIGSATDIDDQKRAEEELRKADQRKDEFLAMLAHELRNPLGAITNAVHLFGVAGNSEAVLEWGRNVIDRQVAHLTRLVDDLLDVFRITQGKLTLQKSPMELAAAVALGVETTRPLIEARKQVLSVRLPSEPIPVEGDLNRLAQVVGNLLNNAIKYSDEGGTIALVVERAENEALIMVRDSGLGIPLEMQPRIFDLFVQVDPSIHRSQGGLGVGLTLVRSLVEMHGGSVDAFSEGPGQGSEFVVRLPLIAMPAPEEKEGPMETSGRPSGARRKVLVVDDNRDSAETVAKLLEIMGHQVRTARDGFEALDATKQFAPEVVLLDIGLPGLDGYELARQLREQPDFGSRVLVALTGYGQEEDRRRSKEAGFDFHLVKPVDPETLLALIDRS